MLSRIKTQEGGVVLSGGRCFSLLNEGKTFTLRYWSPRKSWFLILYAYLGKKVVFLYIWYFEPKYLYYFHTAKTNILKHVSL